jgi:beta-lactamase regulating signal transducer with metallopeptidase domain
MAALDRWTAAVISFGAWTVLQATLLLAGAFLLSFCLRRRSAAARHGVWTVANMGLLVLPILSLVLPALPIHFPAVMTVERVVGDGVSTQVVDPPVPQDGIRGGSDEWLPAAPGSPAPAVKEPAADQWSGLDPGSHRLAPPESSRKPLLQAFAPGLLLFWAMGALLLGLRFVLAVFRAVALCRAAEPSREHGWTRTLTAARRRAGFRRAVSLRFSGAVRTAFAGGLRRPVVLLPSRAGDWCEERRALVLLHEITHLKRLDPLRQILGQLALCIYWFHPLAWVGLRMAAVAREDACDETVVARSRCKPSAYARHLVALAAADELPLPAFSRTHRPPLEKRVMKILDSSAPRRPWMSAAATATALAWLLAVAAAAPAEVGEAAVQSAMVTPGTSVSSPPPAPVSTDPSLSVSADPTLHRADEAAPLAAASDGSSSAGEAALTRSVAALDPAQGCRPSGDGINFDDSRDFVGSRPGAGGWFRQQSLDELMLCMRVHGPVRIDPDRALIEEMPEASWTVLAIVGPGISQRMEIVPANGAIDHTWIVNGERRIFDDAAREWRDAMLTLLYETGAVARIRADEARLRGEVASIRGAEARTLGEVAALRGAEARLAGEVAQARGEIARIQGAEARILAEVASLRGAEARLAGEVTQARAEASRMRIGEVDFAGAGVALREAAIALARAQTAVNEQTSRDLQEMIQRIEELSASSWERIREIESTNPEVQALAAQRVAELQLALEALRREQEVRRSDLLNQLRNADSAAEIERLENLIQELDASGRTARLRESAESARLRLLELVDELR